MPSLAGAVTALSLIGVPAGHAVFEGGTKSETGRPPLEATRLGLTATPGRYYGSFGGKSSIDIVAITVSDTASLTVVEDPIDERFLTAADTVYLRITEVLSRLNHIGVTDTASLLLSEGVELQGTGVNEETPTDTASLSITEAVVIDVSIDVTDTASLSLTEDTPTIDVSVLAITATDTASLSLTETTITQRFTGLVSFPTGDTASLRLLESVVLDRFDPDELAYITRVVVTMDAPTITFRMTGGR